MLKAYKMEISGSFEQYQIDNIYEKADKINHPENYILTKSEDAPIFVYSDDENSAEETENLPNVNKEIVDLSDAISESDDVGKGDEIND